MINSIDADNVQLLIVSWHSDAGLVDKHVSPIFHVITLS
jgi:hypothetical protein